jgi:hypothetical protein
MAPLTDNDNNTYFLYALVKEGGNDNEQTRTNLRIIYWGEDVENQYPAGFVIYGERTPVGSGDEYITYRLQLYSVENVLQFVKTILGQEKEHTIELHQFVGVTDNSEDAYHIDWQNTPENKTTELAAPRFDFQSTLENILNIIENVDVV